MPPVPRAPGSVPPCAGSSTARLSPPCCACEPNGEATAPATPPCGEGAAAVACDAGVAGAGCCVCEGAGDGETITAARSATHSSPSRERDLIRRMFLTYSSIPNPSLHPRRSKSVSAAREENLAAPRDFTRSPRVYRDAACCPRSATNSRFLILLLPRITTNESSQEIPATVAPGFLQH